MRRTYESVWRTIVPLAMITAASPPRSMSAQTRDDILRLTKACEARTLTACEQLGVMYRLGEHVAQDSGRAVTLLTRGCDGGVPVACVDLGHMYRKGEGVATDFPKRQHSFARACQREWRKGFRTGRSERRPRGTGL
jgi:hypothetical protein